MWKTRSISTRTKNLYSAFVTPILVYGSRCWYLRKEDGRRILEAAMSWLRRIAGSIRTNRIRNEITWKVLEQRGILFDRIRKKEDWHDWVCRKNGRWATSNQNIILSRGDTVDGTRSRWRQTKTSMDNGRKDLHKKTWLYMTTVLDTIRDRRKWGHLLKTSSSV